FVARIDNESQIVTQQRGRGERRLRWPVGSDPQIQTIIQNLPRDVARVHAVDGDFDFWILAAETRKRRKKRVDGTFVDTKRKSAAAEAGKVLQAPLSLLAQDQHSLCVFDEQCPCLG